MHLEKIIEVIYAIAEFKDPQLEKLEKIRADKSDKRGKFEKRVILKKRFSDSDGVRTLRYLNY